MSALASSAAASVRADVYRWLAGVFLAPTAERLSRLDVEGRALLERAAVAPPHARLLADAVASFAAKQDARPLQAEHTRLFGAAVGGLPAPPFAGEYLTPGAPWETLGDLETFFGRIGVGPRPEIAGRADHLSVELEALALLCRVEEKAIDAGCADDLALARGEAVRFLDLHALRWLPAFRDRVAAADRLGTYAQAAHAAEAFLREDRAWLGQLDPPLVASE